MRRWTNIKPQPKAREISFEAVTIESRPRVRLLHEIKRYRSA
ncbi:hypothetical protein [Thermococcus sp.]|nr:hypothetical protein [Thermococcus sp.]